MTHTYGGVQGDLHMNPGGTTKLSSRYARLPCADGSFLFGIQLISIQEEYNG